MELGERGRVLADEASWALRDVTRAAVDADYAIARRMGLRQMDYTALSHVFTGEGTLSPRRLSDRLGISTGSTSELLDRLERAGHLERRRDLTDRRRVSLQPTETSIGEVIATLAPLFAALDDLAGHYSDVEQQAIAGYLRQAATLMRDFAANVTVISSAE